ncbi:MAG: hypothetical protein MZV63_65870 [Marinilabiliales bacterium]|nr:hypothetical protein [Marinilabiliales bacterium]
MRAARIRADEPAVGGRDPRRVQSVHVGRRPAEVVDEALPFGVLRHPPDLLEDGFFAPRDDPVALVERERAERAPADAAPMGLDREAGHAELREALRDAAGEGQAVDAVEVGRRVVGSGVLDDEAVGVLLGDRLPVRQALLGLAELVLVGRGPPRTTG